MAKCYKCDMCGVITVLSTSSAYGESEELFIREPAMIIYSGQKSYDICPNCSKKIEKYIEEKGIK